MEKNPATHSFKQLIYQKCAHCERGYDLYICFSCKELIHNACIKCHAKKSHRGMFISPGMICPHCESITKAPNWGTVQVFYAERLLGYSTKRIAEELKKTEHTIRRLRGEMINLCTTCCERLLPPIEYLKIIFALGDGLGGRKRQDEVAADYNMTEYKVRKIIKICREKYGIDFKTLRYAKDFRLRCIGGSKQIDAVQPVEGVVKPEHPKAGYSWQYDVDGGDKGPSHYEGMAYGGYTKKSKRAKKRMTIIDGRKGADTG